MVRITTQSWSRKLMMEIRRRKGFSALQRLREEKRQSSWRWWILPFLAQLPSPPRYPSLAPFPAPRSDPPYPQVQVLEPAGPGPHLALDDPAESASPPPPMETGPATCSHPDPGPSRTNMARTLPNTVSCCPTRHPYGSRYGAKDAQAISASNWDGKGTPRALGADSVKVPPLLT